VICPGGWNNNPNALHFQSVFRRLLNRCGVQPGATGNVVALDDTTLSCVCTTPEHASAEELPTPFEETHNLFHDHDYSSPMLNSLVQNSVVYIAGWVVRKILKSLTCDTCRQSLVTVDHPKDFTSAYHLLTVKNNGGLVVPSEGCVKTLFAAEKAVRHLLHTHKASNKIKPTQVVIAVCGAMGTDDVFLLGSHIVDTQHGIDNHHFTLIRLLVHTFLQLRQHHIAKLHTLRIVTSGLIDFSFCTTCSRPVYFSCRAC